MGPTESRPDLVSFARLLPEPALLLDTSGGVLAANLAAARLLGRATRELEGRSLADLLGEDPARVGQILAAFARTATLLPAVLRVPTGDGNGGARLACRGGVVARANGSPAVLLLRFDPERGSAARFRLLSRKLPELGREIPRRRRLQRERDELLRREMELRRRAEEATRLKDRFLATISHELRTPLNAVLGWAHVLQSHCDDEQAREMADTIARNAELQARLVDDLIDYSRIVAGRLRIEPRPVALREVVQAAARAALPLAASAGVRLEVAEDPEWGPVVRGDAARLQQVLGNLLSNAIAHTPAGKRVVVRARDGGHPGFAVEDEGVGIEPDLLPAIFDPFQSGARAVAPDPSRQGLGLGLSIARNLVELHGGAIAVESAPGRGSTFTVELPPAPPDTSRAGVREAPPRQELHGPARSLRVLLVDDHEDSLRALARLLALQGTRVHTAASADAALAELARAPVDVLVSDIRMPGKDGHALLRELRASPDPRLRDLPAVALSAYSGSEDRRRSLASGFQAHLSKPIDPRRLLEVLGELVRGR